MNRRERRNARKDLCTLSFVLGLAILPIGGMAVGLWGMLIGGAVMMLAIILYHAEEE